jgi:hypothetical protein
MHNLLSATSYVKSRIGIVMRLPNDRIRFEGRVVIKADVCVTRKLPLGRPRTSVLAPSEVCKLPLTRLFT